MKKITQSYTIGISTKVVELKKEGIDICDLSIGDPDFEVPQKAINYGIESLNKNITKYNLVNGMEILRKEISKKLSNENKCNYDIDEIVVSSGAKNCLTNSILAISDINDDILVVVPYWVSYTEMIKILDRNPILVETSKENDFKVTKDDLKKYITDKTKAIIINNPSNPTGVIYTKEELQEIVDFCYKNNIYIISDEIYEKICFDTEFVSIASLSKKAFDITITINGFSKSSAMTGLRVGYTASNKEIAKLIKNIQGHLISHPSITAQYIAYGYLLECSEDTKKMVEIYKRRRNLASNKLDEMKIDYIYPQGAFYLFFDISSFKEKIDYKDSFSLEFCNKLLDEKGVALVPGIAFGKDDFVRISFACNEEILLKGIEKLGEFIRNL